MGATFVNDMINMNHKLYTDIFENNFVQSVALKRTTDMLFSFENIFDKMTNDTYCTRKEYKKYNEPTYKNESKCSNESKYNEPNKDDYNNSFIITLMKYIFPFTIIGNNDSNHIRDMSLDIKKCLDLYPNILKTITTKHKSLRRKVEQYMDSNTYINKDKSHLDDDYIMFWCNLLKKNMYVKSNNLYKLYSYNCKDECENSDKTNILLNVKNDQNNTFFMIVDKSNTEMEKYISNNNLKKWSDPKKLKTKKIHEIHELCIYYGIRLDEKYKKDILIEELSKKLIFD